MSRTTFSALVLAVSIFLANLPSRVHAATVQADAAPAAMILSSPTPYAVFQRSASNTARLPIAGHVEGPVASIEAKATLMSPYHEGVDGKSVEFKEIAKSATGDFTGNLEVPAGGWYSITVKANDAAGHLLGEQVVDKVGVGEVFVAAGHSFCSKFNADAPGKAVDDRVATCADWTKTPAMPLSFRHCDDPLRPGDENRASPWPPVGDALVSRLHVPVLFVCTGMGGSTIQDWRRGSQDPAVTTRGYPTFRQTLLHLTPYTGLRAVIWLGNENDLMRSPSAEEFSRDMEKVIVQSRKDSGYANLPWVIAFDAYDPAVTHAVGAEKKQRSKEKLDRGTEQVLQRVPFTYDGPQTDDLGPEFRRSDGDHFNPAGLEQLGPRFARKIIQAFFPPPPPVPMPSGGLPAGG